MDWTLNTRMLMCAIRQAHKLWWIQPAQQTGTTNGQLYKDESYENKSKANN